VRQFQNIDQRNFQAINVAGDDSDNNRVDFRVQNTQQQVAGAVLGEFGEMEGGGFWVEGVMRGCLGTCFALLRSVRVPAAPSSPLNHQPLPSTHHQAAS